MLNNRDAVEHAASVFAHGWSTSRWTPGTTLDYTDGHHVIHLEDPLRDYPNELVTVSQEAAHSIEIAGHAFPGLPHCITVFTHSMETTTQAYAALGYIIWKREYLMEKVLHQDTLPVPIVPVQRLLTPEEAIFFNQSGAGRPVDPTRLDVVRTFMVLLDGHVAASGRSVIVNDHAASRSALVDGIGTVPQFQRRGLGSALMQQIHIDAAHEGCVRANLIASVEGHALYLTLGYSVLADTLVFIPQVT